MDKKFIRKSHTHFSRIGRWCMIIADLLLLNLNRRKYLKTFYKTLKTRQKAEHENLPEIDNIKDYIIKETQTHSQSNSKHSNSREIYISRMTKQSYF